MVPKEGQGCRAKGPLGCREAMRKQDALHWAETILVLAVQSSSGVGVKGPRKDAEGMGCPFGDVRGLGVRRGNQGSYFAFGEARDLTLSVQ